MLAASLHYPVAVPTVFVYGALMEAPHALQNGRRALVRDYDAGFVVVGIPGFEPRFLGLHERPGATAHGVVFDIDEAEWVAMSRHESTYERRVVQAECGGESVPALALITPAELVGSPGVPSARYARKLVRGAEAHGLPPELLERYRHLAATGPRFSGFLDLVFPLVSLLAPYLGARLATILVGTLLALPFALVLGKLLGLLLG